MQVLTRKSYGFAVVGKWAVIIRRSVSYEGRLQVTGRVMELGDPPRLHLVDRLSLWRLSQGSVQIERRIHPVLRYLVYRLFEILEFALCGVWEQADKWIYLDLIDYPSSRATNAPSRDICDTSMCLPTQHRVRFKITFSTATSLIRPRFQPSPIVTTKRFNFLPTALLFFPFLIFHGSISSCRKSPISEKSVYSAK